ELRILDTPGLNAANQGEQEAARELLTRSATGMNAIVIVQAANRVAEAMMDPTITGNPYLSAWSRDPVRYRLVLTSAFSDHSTAQALLEERVESAEALADRAVELISEQVAGTFTPPCDREVLRRVLYPIDLGRSLSGLRQQPDLTLLVAANEVLLGRLRDSLRFTASEDGRYLSASDLPAHVARIIEERALGRQGRQVEADERVRAARQATESARQRADSARGDMEEAREQLRLFETAL